MEKKPELFVIDPSIIRPEIEAFNLVSRLSSIPVSFHLPALEGLDTIWEAERLSNCSGVVILGSAASVRDQRSWQKELVAWLEKKINAHCPILGICFGHQLLAYMHGASVVACIEEKGAERKTLVGFRNVKLKSDSRLDLPEKEQPIFVYHNEKVKNVPDGFEIFATSDIISIDGLRHKDLPIWSFQGHIDATETFCLNSNYSETDQFPNLKYGNQILKSFLDLVHARK